MLERSLAQNGCQAHRAIAAGDLPIWADVPSDDLVEFEAAVFDGYVAGLRDVGCPVATDDVRMAFAPAVALWYLGFLTRCRPLLVDIRATPTPRSSSRSCTRGS